MRKSQIELWMLSKFAILFFIMALAIFLFTFSQSEKGGLCNVETGSQAALISNAINNVLNNPIEDQQLVVKLPPAITLGSGLSAYTVNITYIKQTQGPAMINVQSSSVGSSGCTSNQPTIFIPSSTIVSFYSDAISSTSSSSSSELTPTFLTAYPSAATARTHFLIIIKCNSKLLPIVKTYLFVVACTSTDASTCFGYGIYNNFKQCSFS